MADTWVAWYAAPMHEHHEATRIPTGPNGARFLLYRYRTGHHGRGGRRELINSTRSTRVNVETLSERLSPGRYRMEWRSAEGRVERVRLLVVRYAPPPAR
ncbi:MAG: hypothetical protein U0324_17800 [Polyangiales bacterium]